MHPLLARQLRKAFAEPSPLQQNPEFAEFVRLVDAAYAAEDEDRAQLERSLHLASEELVERNRQLENELTERKRLEIELRLGEKLRAVGQLAAGIAHEINTPVQFVGDSLHFLGEALAELTLLLAACEQALAVPASARERAELELSIHELSERIDLPYLREAMPRALARCGEGVERVATIVRALKTLAHPDSREQERADLNAAIENTLIVGASQVRYVADVELDLRAGQSVLCHVGEIQQVLLNLIVNAAHAIAERVGESGEKGKIRIATREDDGQLVITVADDGVGIPAAARERIFEPFFTTKPVGKGSGQGLFISRSLVVERHGGELTFESRVGEGTTFTVRLPIGGRARRSSPHLQEVQT